jgi:cell pole-organizing protein PopZ
MREPADLAPVDSIVSAATAASGISSFGQLSRSVRSNRPGITVEQLAEELMRPMLRQWLDENLPDMVERLVRREIERMARAGDEN